MIASTFNISYKLPIFSIFFGIFLVGIHFDSFVNQLLYLVGGCVPESSSVYPVTEGTCVIRSPYVEKINKDFPVFIKLLETFTLLVGLFLLVAPICILYQVKVNGLHKLIIDGEGIQRLGPKSYHIDWSWGECSHFEVVKSKRSGRYDYVVIYSKHGEKQLVSPSLYRRLTLNRLANLLEEHIPCRGSVNLST